MEVRHRQQELALALDPLRGPQGAALRTGSVPTRVIEQVPCRSSATIDWCVSLGFALTDRHEECGVVNWAHLTFGDSAIMLDAGGKAAIDRESDVVLYVQPVDVDEFFSHLPRGVQVVHPPYDAFHGRRELTLKDNNGFTVAFAKPFAE